MPDLTRREWTALVLGGLAASVPLGRAAAQGAKSSTFAGVVVGVQSYSLRDRPLDEAIAGMVEAGLFSCELWQGHVEPRLGRGTEAREALRKWRLEVPLAEFEGVRAKFDRAGVELSAYNLSFRDDFTDAEIERGFEMARALGVEALTASGTLSTVPRIDRYARRFRIPVGMHNHSEIRPNEFATPEDFASAMDGSSEFIAVNLDIGHFTAANFDSVEYLRQHHGRIVTLHIKDRKRDQGPYTPFGEGDAPIREVLRLVRDNRWPIPANIEYEYQGADTIAELKKSLAYCREALTAST